MGLASWIESHVPEIVFPLEASALDELFSLYKQHCVSTASPLSVDAAWGSRLHDYLVADSTPEDDKEKIRKGRRREPVYYQGGAILDHNSGAGAMTLDDCVFVRPGSWDPNTWVHEAVHVGQYGDLGVSGFLAAYFGTSAIGVIEQLAKGESVDLMTSSSLETEAYAIGNRFAPEGAR